MYCTPNLHVRVYTCTLWPAGVFTELLRGEAVRIAAAAAPRERQTATLVGVVVPQLKVLLTHAAVAVQVTHVCKE